MILCYIFGWFALYYSFDLWLSMKVLHIFSSIYEKELLSCDKIIQKDDFIIMPFYYVLSFYRFI